MMKTLVVDDKWTIEYCPNNNDAPCDLLRNGERKPHAVNLWMSDQVAMFYALLDAKEKLDIAVAALRECEAEIDEYSRQEYPLDHPVHDRYRQRDYDANPARIAIKAITCAKGSDK